MDTGADITLFRKGLLYRSESVLRPAFGHAVTTVLTHKRAVYYVRLTLEGFVLATVRCIATNRADVLLGRNVLNRFLVILEGKNLTFELKDP